MVVLIIRNSNEAQPLTEMALKAVAGLERKLSIIVTGEKYNAGLKPVGEHDEKWIRGLETETVHKTFRNCLPLGSISLQIPVPLLLLPNCRLPPMPRQHPGLIRQGQQLPLDPFQQ